MDSGKLTTISLVNEKCVVQFECHIIKCHSMKGRLYLIRGDEHSGGALPLIFCIHVRFDTYLLGGLFTLKT